MSAMLANLLVAGVPKAGTTSLFSYLAQHPEVCASRVKEPHMFTPTTWGEAPAMPPGDYDAMFACPELPFRLEATPDYFNGGGPLIDALRAQLDDPRVIVSLREPTDRLWSHYRFKRLNGRFGPEIDFATFLDRCEAVLRDGREHDRDAGTWRELANGFYAEPLEAWFDAFGDDRFRVVFFDDIASDPAAVAADLFAWLGLAPMADGMLDVEVRNQGLPARSIKAHQRGRRLVLPLRRRLDTTTGAGMVLKNTYRRLNRSTEPVPQLAPELRARVDELYRPANRALAERLATRGYGPLPAWLDDASPASGGLRE